MRYTSAIYIFLFLAVGVLVPESQEKSIHNSSVNEFS